MPTDIDPDKIAENELDLWAENTEDLYGQYKAIIANMKRKIAAGKYSPTLAPTAWKYWYDAASDSYNREFGYRFPVAVRRALAAERAAYEYERIMRGEHYDIMPRLDCDSDDDA